MDIKKLIGTIIGVTLFAVLIAGATFAWLTFGTTVTDGAYNGTTMNFLVDYAQGSTIEDMPMLDSTTATPSQAAMLSVTATKRSTSADGHLSILLTSTANSDDTTLTKFGVIRWAICRGTPCTDFSQAVNAGIAKEGDEIVLLNDAALADGATCANVGNKIKAMSLPSTTITQLNSTYQNQTGFEDLKTNPLQAKTNAVNAEYSLCSNVAASKTTGSASSTNIISSTGTTYYVYFWMDGESLYNAHKDQKYTGYIHAYATQLQN